MKHSASYWKYIEQRNNKQLFKHNQSFIFIFFNAMHIIL